MEADKHLMKARRELDDAIKTLNSKIAGVAAGKKLPTRTHILPLESPMSDFDEVDEDAISDLVDGLLHIDTKDPFDRNSTQPQKKKLSSMIYNILPLASVALGLVGKTLEGSSLGAPVSAIAKGACFAVDLLIQERKRKQLFLDEIDRISYQARRVHELQRHADIVLLPLLREKALNLLSAIALFLGETLDYFAKNLLKQIKKSVLHGIDTWGDSTARLQLAYEEYDQALLLQIASAVLRHPLPHPQQSDIVAADDEAFRKWLQPSFAENETKLLANLAQRAEGTLQWVLDMPELRSWRLADASTQAATLWLTGLPGVGKSCISAYLGELLKKQYPDDIVLNFFRKRGTAGLASAFVVVRTLCYQLSRTDSFFRKFLQKMPALPSSNAKDEIPFLVETLLRQPLASSSGRCIFVLLDGLDEIEEASMDGSSKSRIGSYESRTDLEILLGQLVTLPRVKILATSRRLPEVHGILSKSGAVRQIDPSDNGADIEKYVAHRVANSARLRQGFSDIKLDPVPFFSSKANGVFLWVAIVLDVLERAPSLKLFKKGLDEVHPTMNSIYNDIFASAEQRGTLSFVLEILDWCISVPSPFTIRQMALAVEISLGDKVLHMEEFLRTECGALLHLLPRVGADEISDEALEIHIGHETFQAWLAEKLGPEAKLTNHARAATACLKYLLGSYSDESLKSYALQRWRWHLRLSMGISARDFTSPFVAFNDYPDVDGAPALPVHIVVDLFCQLYNFLLHPAASDWALSAMDKHNFREHIFWEVHHTWLDVYGWCKINKDSLSDAVLESLRVGDALKSRLKSWRDTLDHPQVIAQMLWPPICHAWLWNTSLDWWGAYIFAKSLQKIYIYAYDKSLFTEKMLKVDTVNTVAGEIHNKFEDSPVSNECLEAVKEAGGFNNLSGVCAANLSVIFYQRWRLSHNHEGDHALNEALALIQEAIDYDPNGSPKNYYHLGMVYSALAFIVEDAEEKKRLKEASLDAYRGAIARDPDHLTDARGKLYQDQVQALMEDQDPRAHDEAVELLERAIVDDPANAANRWFHHLFDIHKKRGDLDAARQTYQRLIACFPTEWHTKWKDIADTWIDGDLYEETRTFDWRNWCDALLKAIQQDPSYAHSYWADWISKADELVGYQHFGTAADIFAYGVEKTAARTDPRAKEACAKFHMKLGEALCQQARWKEGTTILEEAWARMNDLDVFERRDTLMWLAWAYMAEQRWDDVHAAADKRLALNPHELWGDRRRFIGHGWKGEALLLAGKPVAAAKELEAAIATAEESLGKDATVATGVLDKAVGLFLVDLGHAYERMGREGPALNMFRKAIPHIEQELKERIEMRTQHDVMWRREGRWHMLLGWLLERVHGIESKSVLEQYELAVWVFGKTIYVEDDFIEIRDGEDADAAVERAKNGVRWTYPGKETFFEQKLRWNVGFARADWSNRKYKDDVQQSRRRGH